MAIRNWKSANEELYANFCKRMDAVEKGNLSVLTDMYQMMRECTPPEALLLYNWLSELINGNGKKCTEYSQSTMGRQVYRYYLSLIHI